MTAVDVGAAAGSDRQRGRAPRHLRHLEADDQMTRPRRAVFNVCWDEIDIYHFEPGQWELIYFGADHAGDTAPLLPGLFPDENEPSWQAFMASGLAQWPPVFPEGRASR